MKSHVIGALVAGMLWGTACADDKINLRLGDSLRIGHVIHEAVTKPFIGSENLEVGVVSGSHGALPHSHPGIDQVCYMIAGRAVAEVGGERSELGPGDACFFPADMPHTFTAVSEEPVRVLVIYTPSYGEKGAVTHPSA